MSTHTAPPVVLPTHTCFTDAYEELARIAQEEPAFLPAVVLVYAIVAPAPTAGRVRRFPRYAHAWLELSGDDGTRVVRQRGILAGEVVSVDIEAAVYEAEARIEQAWRYPAAEIIHAAGGGEIRLNPPELAPAALALCADSTREGMDALRALMAGRM